MNGTVSLMKKSDGRLKIDHSRKLKFCSNSKCKRRLYSEKSRTKMLCAFCDMASGERRFQNGSRAIAYLQSKGLL